MNAVTYEKCYTASPQATDRGARDLCAYALRAGIGPANRARMGTACTEVLDNVWRHAYPTTPGPVTLTAQIDDRAVHVSIEDKGVGFDESVVILDGAAPIDDAGLVRAAKLSEELHIDSLLGGGTRVELVFAAYRVHFDEECSVDLTELDFFTPRTSDRVLRAIQDTGDDFFHLSPALAVVVGRLLAGPDPRRALRNALRRPA